MNRESGIDETGVSWCCVDFCWLASVFFFYLFFFLLLSVFLAFCISSFGDCTHLRQKETADKREKSYLFMYLFWQ